MLKNKIQISEIKSFDSSRDWKVGDEAVNGRGDKFLVIDDRKEPENPTLYCQGKCDHEFKKDERGIPYVKCWGCGREIGRNG